MSFVSRRFRHRACLPMSGAILLAATATPVWAESDESGENGASKETTTEIGEIIVTAQKREEKLRDVPVPVTAVRAADLLAVNQTKAQDFFASVPGINLQFQNNRAQLAIRGISTGPASGNPVVGFTIDDVPFGSSTGQGGLFGSAPDIDPSELQRVEVLRGPQGTLYGAASIGGLVKYVTVDPDFEGISGSVGAGINAVEHGGELGYNVRGAVNLPVAETVAIRASAFTRKEAGYIDNIRTGESDVNNSRVSGGRLALLWKPSSDFSLKLSALYQKRDIHGSSNIDTTTGSYYQQTDNIGSGHSQSDAQMYTANINATLGSVKLTSISAFSRATNFDYLDFSAAPFVPIQVAPAFPGVDPVGDIFRQGYDVDKYTHETRLSGGIGQNIDWIVGAFYTRENAKYDLDNYATDPGTGTVLGKVIKWRDTIKYKEYAGFANLTARLSDRFDVQFGGRYSHNEQSMVHHQWTQDAPFPAVPTEYINTPTASGNAFTYQVSPRFKPTPDHMIYGRIASGYRTGGTNPVCGPQQTQDGGTLDVPCQFKPDRTVNYELGAKGVLAGGLLSYDASLFMIDWTDIQIIQVLGDFTYNGNAGKARSRGVEISLEARPTDRLTLSAWWSHVDATLRQDFTDGSLFSFYAAKGDRLPYTAKNSGRVSFDYQVPASDIVGFSFGGSATYVGERRGEFVPSADVASLRQVYPDYVQFDVNAGMELHNLKIDVYIQNLTNKHGVIGGGFWNQTSFNADWLNYAQPRTIGMNLQYSF